LPQPTLSYRTLLLQLPSVKAAFKLKRLTEIPSLTFPLNGETAISGQSPEQDSAIRAVSTSIHLADLPAIAELTSTQSSDTQSSDSGAIAFESHNQPRLPGESDQDFQQFKEGVIFALSSSLANHSLHPVIRLQLSQYYRLNWHHFLESPAPGVSLPLPSGVSDEIR
jgi:hypothetical protein